jgi:TolB-like protein
MMSRLPTVLRAVVALSCAGSLLLPALAPLAWAQGQANGRKLIAVLDLEAVGATKVEASAMTDRLREELLKTGNYTMVDRSQMEAVLNEQALQQAGCTSQECAVQVGQVLGVREIVTGRVTKITEEQWLVSAQMIDVETAETLRAESLRHRGDFFTMMDVTIVTLATKLSGAAAIARQPAVPPAVPPPAQPLVAETPKAEPAAEGGGWPWWVWALIGVGVLGAAAAAGGGDEGCTNCGEVGFSW